MPESREGDLVRLLETEVRLEAMLAVQRRENEASVAEARRDADLLLRGFEADLPGFLASLRQSIESEFADEIRAIEARAAAECDRYDAVSETAIRDLASLVIGRLLGRSTEEAS